MLYAYFDGCCEPINPGGTAGFGAAIFKEGAKLFETSGYIAASPQTSNNVAEYRAFIAVLDWLAAENLFHDEIMVHGDSKLVIEQMFGKWKIHGGLYAGMAREAKAKRIKFSRMKGRWIPREQNTFCDGLSKSHLKRLGVELLFEPEVC